MPLPGMIVKTGFLTLSPARNAFDFFLEFTHSEAQTNQEACG